MSARNRAVLLALAALVLVTAIIATTAGGGDDSDGQPATSAATPVPAEQDQARPERERTPTPTPEPPLRVVVKDGQPVGGVQELEVEKGDDARFTVVSDVDETVHVHGYDLEKPVGPGAPARFSFKATIDGILEVELEHSAVEILSLRVTP